MDKRTFYVLEFPLVLLAGICIGLVLAEDFAEKSSAAIFFKKRSRDREKEKEEEEISDE